MKYQIVWKPQAVDDVKGLDKRFQKQIVEKITSIVVKPERFLDYIKKYRVHKLRAGDYRIFIDLDHKEKTIEVLTVRHRKNAYKRAN
ncbi:MAG TPA: type II toxin-antitoxin system RelE/ParE family toxin [Candidatus Altiarchaeales archaeon]|nr:type II toxin-antitoxin system RelE/ParE family toxin [Candidatus Altiarchaeales archaeon]